MVMIMKDKYLFRAKRIGDGEWVRGSYLYDYGRNIHYIFANEIVCPNCINDCRKEFSLQDYEVDPSTICRCTGLKDKNDKLIWENDICNYYNSEDKDGIGIIKNDYVLWIDETISMRHKMTPLFYLQCKDEWEVIGNIFDNPDLLNKREETYCKDSNDYER